MGKFGILSVVILGSHKLCPSRSGHFFGQLIDIITARRGVHYFADGALHPQISVALGSGKIAEKKKQ